MKPIKGNFVMPIDFDILYIQRDYMPDNFFMGKHKSISRELKDSLKSNKETSSYYTDINTEEVGNDGMFPVKSLLLRSLHTTKRIILKLNFVYSP